MTPSIVFRARTGTRSASDGLMENTAISPTAFVFAATDPAGKRRYVESTADNAAAARSRLEIQGYTEIDVVRDAFDAKLDRAMSGEAFDDMTLHEKMEFRRRCARPDAARFIAWHFIRKEALTILSVAAWVWWRASGDEPWSAISFGEYAYALGYFALLMRVRMPGRLFNRLIEARAWNRWDDVDAAVKKIQKWEWFTGQIIPQYELLFSEARALAGRGGLAAALEKVKPLESAPGFDRALYFGLLASLYDIVHDVAGRIAVGEKALALDPESPTARIDLAFALALHAHDPKRAREVLAVLDPADVKPMARPYLDLVCGVIALDEGRTAEAEKLIAGAVEGWHAFTGDPLAKAFARVLQGYHATALRRLGRTEEAGEKFAEVRAFLEATSEHDLLRRWSRA